MLKPRAGMVGGTMATYATFGSRRKYTRPPIIIGEMFEDNQWGPETMDSTKLYIYTIFSYLSLKGGTSWPVFAYPNCQLHYSCTLGLLGSKIRVSGTQRLPQGDGQSENTRRLLSDQWGGSIYSVGTLDKGKTHMLGGTEREGAGFHHATQMLHNLKVINCLFLGFSILHFWILVARG